MRRASWIALALALLAANATYAWAMPNVLASLYPAMPHGFRESDSPTTDARVTFVRVDVGVEHARFAWRDGSLPYPAVVTGGVAAGDVDGDGWIDLYFPPGGPKHPAHLYMNRGDWRFEDATSAAGLDALGFGAGASFADVDNDGDSDLAVAIEGDLALYLNDGDGRFADVSRERGLTLDGVCGARPCQPTSLAWLDADRDGLLDLYVVNNLDWRAPGLHTSGQDYASLIYFAAAQRSVLFLQREDGTFADATRAWNVPNTGKGLALVATDLDADGRPDLATANDITENALYLGRDGTFENVARAAGVSEVKTSMGIASGDLDGDGRLDLVVTNFRGDKLSLLLQEGPLVFRYATETNGLGASWRGTGWGVSITDVDLDGWDDILHAVGRAVPLDPHRNDLQNVLFPELLEDAEDQLFRNLGHGRFAEATPSAGDLAGTTNTRAILAVDLDNDGDEDIVRVNVNGDPVEILRNDARHGHRGLQLTLQGDSVNRDAIGARVEATLPDGRTLTRERQSANGFQTGLGPILTFGLAEHTRVDVTIHWPDRKTQTIAALPAGRHTISQT